MVWGLAAFVEVLLHGALGSWDEVAWGLLLSMVLIVDAWVILKIWRSPISQRSKWLWSILVFFLHMAGWIAFFLSRGLDERVEESRR